MIAQTRCLKYATEEEGFYPVVTDHLGTPKEIFDTKGNCVWKSQSTLWGRTEIKAQKKEPWMYTPMVECNLRFQNQWEDKETGLYYNLNRYYDPDSGQYLSPDPIGLEGGLRTHAYVHDPMQWVDPMGLAGCTKFDNLKAFQYKGLKAKRIRPGTNGKIAVVGRSMGTAKEPGVRDYATALRKKGYDVEIFDGDTIPKSAQKQWNQVTDGGKNWLTNSQATKTKMYSADKAWSQKLVDEGYTVVDIGNPHSKGFSPFYSVEKMIIFK